MVSTATERVERGQQLILTLLGPQWQKHIYRSTRPNTLPKGINYTNKEWCMIQDCMHEMRQKENISIHAIFSLEAIADKYQDHLFLAKLTI